MGIKGVALGLSVSVALTTGLLFEAWNRKSENTGKRDVYRFFGIMALISLVLGILLQAAYSILIIVITPGALLKNLLICMITGIIFLLLLGSIGKLCRIREINTLYTKIFAKVVPWYKNSGLPKT